MNENEQMCRRAMVLRRQGLSYQAIGDKMNVKRYIAQRLCQRITRNGRYIAKRGEFVAKRKKVIASVAILPVLQSGNTVSNIKLRGGVLMYTHVPQSHTGWCCLNSSAAVRASLHRNRRFANATGVKKKQISARTCRRYRQCVHERNLDPGRRARKNWAAPEHLRSALQTNSRVRH